MPRYVTTGLILVLCSSLYATAQDSPQPEATPSDTSAQTKPAERVRPAEEYTTHGTTDDLTRVAARERARNKGRRSVPVLGNEDLAVVAGPGELGVVGPISAAPPGSGRPAVIDASQGEVSSDPVDEESVQDEPYWRERMADAQKRIVELESDLTYARARLLINRLDLIVPMDPMAELRRKLDVDALLAEVAGIEASLADARKEPARIREEGRRARARPGWFR